MEPRILVSRSRFHSLVESCLVRQVPELLLHDLLAVVGRDVDLLGIPRGRARLELLELLAPLLELREGDPSPPRPIPIILSLAQAQARGKRGPRAQRAKRLMGRQVPLCPCDPVLLCPCAPVLLCPSLPFSSVLVVSPCHFLLYCSVLCSYPASAMLSSRSCHCHVISMQISSAFLLILSPAFLLLCYCRLPFSCA